MSDGASPDASDSLRAGAVAVAAVAHVVAAVAAFAVVRALQYRGTSIAFVVAAIVGTYAGAIAHSRRVDATLSGKTRAQLGALLAACALTSGLALYHVDAFAYPEVVLPLAAIGSFVFPFILAQTTWKALKR